MTPKDWLYDKARREGWDEPVWNSNTCVMVNRQTYRLSDFEANKVKLGVFIFVIKSTLNTVLILR